MQGKIAEKNSCTQKSKEKNSCKKKVIIYLFIYLLSLNLKIVVTTISYGNKLLLECKSCKSIAENINIKIQRKKNSWRRISNENKSCTRDGQRKRINAN